MGHPAPRLEGDESGNPRRYLSPGEEQDILGCCSRRRGRLGHTAIDLEEEASDEAAGQRRRRRRPPQISRLHRAHLLQRPVTGRPRRSHQTAEPVPAAFYRAPVMQLLIVHDDAEIREQLGGMVMDYTEHACDRVESNVAAQEWAKKHARCDLLLAQVEGVGVDGLSLGGPLSEIFPGLQVLFLPGYPASEQRLEIGRTKVFPEPIDGERLLEAIELAAAAEAD